MDMNTGRTYASREEARAAGVSDGDLHLLTDEQQQMLRSLEFKKHKPFATIKNRNVTQKGVLDLQAEPVSGILRGDLM